MKEIPSTVAANHPPQRIAVLDQMRGYAIFGMLLVNAKGLFHFSATQLRNHRASFTYADTIAQLFVFVVGYASLAITIDWPSGDMITESMYCLSCSKIVDTGRDVATS